MADRYWVGGTGTWSTTTTNWSATSGGAGGASVPTAADNVIFDVNSGTNFTVTVGTAARLCLNLTFASGVNGITFAGTATMTVSGSLSLPASGVTWTHTGVITFNSASAITLSTNGVALTSPMTFSAAGSKTLLTALTTTGTVTLSAGTFNLSTYTLTCGAFNASSSTTRSITYGAGSSIVITGTGSALTMTTLTGFTFTGTSNIIFTYSGATAMTIAAGATTYAQSQNLYITAGTYSLTFTGNARTLDFTGFSGTYAQAANSNTLYANLIYSATMVTSGTSGVISFVNTSGTQTITTNGITVNNNFNRNGAGGTIQFLDAFIQGSARSFTMTAGTIDLNSYSTVFGIFAIVTGTHSFINGSITCTSVTHTSGDLTVSSTNTVTASGTYTLTAGTITLGDASVLSVGLFSSSNSGTRSISYGVGAELRITGTGTVWNTATTTNFSDSGTSYVTFTNATAGTRTITTGTMTSAQAQNFYITAGTGSLTLTTGGFINNLDFTGFSGTYAQAATSVTLFGNVIFSATMTSTTTTGELRFTPSSSATVTTNGHVLGCTLNAYGDLFAPTKSLVFADAFSQTVPGALRIQNANLDFNSQTYSIGTLAFWSGSGVPLNYGATLVAGGFEQAGRNVTLGTGGYQISTSGTYTLTSSTLTLAASYTMSVGVFSSSNVNTRSIVFGTDSAIELTSSGTVWDTGTVTNFSRSGTSNIRLVYAGGLLTTVNTGAMTDGQSLHFHITAGTYEFNATNSSVFRDLDFTGFSGVFDQNGLTCTVYGDLVFSSTMTTAFAGSPTVGSLTMASPATMRTVTTNGITVNTNIYFNGAGGFQLADTFTQNTAARFAVVNGTVDFNSQTYTIGQFYYATGTNSYINYGGTLYAASMYQASGTITVDTTSLLVVSGNYEFISGTINLNNSCDLYVGAFLSPNTNTRVINFASQITNIVTTGSGTVWNVTGATGLTFSGTGNIIIDNPTSTAATITNTGDAFRFFIISGTYTLTLTSGGYFGLLDFTGFTGTLAVAANTYTMAGDLTLGTGMTTTGTAGTNNFSWAGATSFDITTNGVTANFGISLAVVGQTLRLRDAFIGGSGTYGISLTSGTLNLNSYSASIGRLTILTGTHAITNGTLNCETVTHTSGDLSVGTGYNVVASGTYTLAAGTITINDGVDLSVGAFSSSTTAVRSIAFGTGSISLTRSTGGVMLDMTTITNFSYTGTSNVNISTSTSNATSISPSTSATTAQAMNFNITTGTYSFNITANHVVNNLNFTGFSGSYDQASNTVIVYGNLTFSSTMTGSTTGGAVRMAATAGTRTITSNGATIGNSINFNGAGGTFQLTDTFTQASTASFIMTNGTIDFNSQTYTLGVLTFVTGTKSYINYGGTLSAASIIHTSGTVTTGTGALLYTAGNYTFTAGTLTINDGVDLIVGSFSSPGTATRVLAFGTGKVVIKGTGSTTAINLSTSSGFSFTGTDNITVDNTTSTNLTFSAVATATSALSVYVISGTYQTSIVSGSSFRNLDFTGYTGLLALATSTLTIHGNLVLGTGMTTSGTSGVYHLTYNFTSGTRTITTNGVSANFGISLNGIGQTVQLADAFTSDFGYGGLSLTSGTFDLNNKTTSINTLVVLSGTHAITNGTLNTYYVTHTSGDLSVGTGYTVVAASDYTFTAGSITINDGASLTVGQFISTNTNTRSIAFGTGMIKVTGYGTSAWNVTGATGLTYTGTSNITFDAANPGFAATITSTATSTNAFNFNIVSGSYTLTLSSSSIRSLNTAGFSGTFSTSGTCTLYGDLTYGSTTTTTTGSLTLAGTGTTLITSNGISILHSIVMNGSLGIFQLQDALTMTGVADLTLTNGTFDMNGYSTAMRKFILNSGTHAIANGTVSCSAVDHNASTISIGTGYTIAATGTYTLTAGTITINDSVSLTVGTFYSATSSVRVVNFGTGNITTTSSSSAWNVQNTSNLSYTGTSNVRMTYSGGAALYILHNGTELNAFNFYVTAATGYVLIDGGLKTLDFTGSSALDFSPSLDNIYIYGDLILSPTMTTAYNSTYLVYFASTTSTQTITSNGVNIKFYLALTGTSTVTVSGNLQAEKGILHYTGTFSAGTYDLDLGLYNMSGTGVKTINMGSGTWSLNFSADTMWYIESTINLTLNADTSTISLTSSSDKTFRGYGLTYYNINQGGAGVLTITGNNTFNDITATYKPSTVTLTSGSTQTVSNFTLSGTAGNLVTLNSSTSGAPATLSKASGIVDVSYLAIKDSTATGGATWNSPTSSGNVDNGGNTGWLFGAIVSAVLGNFFAFF